MQASNPTTPLRGTEQPIVKIAKPCHENWADMSTTQKGKFCSSCVKEVVDFTSNTNAEISAHLKEAEGSVCGRLYTSQVVTQVSESKFYTFIKRSKKYFATLLAVISVSALFGAKADAQCRYPIKGKMKIDPMPEQTNTNTRETTIRGTVTIANTKTPAAMAAIQVSSAGQVIEQTVTNTNGEYNVQLPAGSVQNQEVSLTTSILGYVDKTIDALKVLKDEITLNFSVEEQFMMMGDIAWYPEEMGEVEIIEDPEVLELLTNEPPKSAEDKNIKEIPEITVDILQGQLSNIAEKQVDYSSQVMMLGMMIAIEPEPKVIEVPEVNEQPEILEIEDQVVANDYNTIITVETSPESPEIIEEVLMVSGFVEMVPPIPHLEITDGPEPIDIQETQNYNPVQVDNIETVNPVVLVDPYPKAPKSFKTHGKLIKINKIRKLYKPKDHKIDLQELVLINGPTQLSQLDETQEPLEMPEELTETVDEGTRETIEPVLDSKIIISLYPNPTTDHFTVDLGGDGQFLMEMYDGEGRQIKIDKIDQSSSRVDTSNLQPGSYLVRISNAMGDQVETKTIVII